MPSRTREDQVGHQFEFHRTLMVTDADYAEDATRIKAVTPSGLSRSQTKPTTYRCTGLEVIWSCKKKLGRASYRNRPTDRPACLPPPLSLFVPDFRHCSGH